jgi:hypothetical protein
MSYCERAVNERSTAVRDDRNPPKRPEMGPKLVNKSRISDNKTNQTANKSDAIVDKSHTTDNKARTSGNIPTTPIQKLDSRFFEAGRVGRV